MKIGVYNRWLNTLGGGERHSMAIAAHLARSHSVDFISHTATDAKALASKLDTNIDNIRFCAVPLQSPSALGSVAAEFDLFINASNAEFIPPLAKRNAMLVYFPVAPPVTAGQRLRRAVAGKIDMLSSQPRYLTGVFEQSESGGRELHGLAQTNRIALPAASVQPYLVRFSLASNTSSVQSVIVELDGQTIQVIRFIQPSEPVPVRLVVPPGRERILTIRTENAPCAESPLLTMTPITMTSRRAWVYNRIFTQTWPELGVRQRSILPADISGIAGAYDILWANSKYTRRWIQAYWNLPSKLLYPPVPVERYLPHSKRQIILSVGRYFASNHNKKHATMLNAFKMMVDEGLHGWELHLVGNVTPGQQHQDYFKRIQRAAVGYPVLVHTNMQNDQLIDLRGASSIYWHAAGYGEDATRNPGKFEHFGVSVVEAMAAGCVPVVVGQGGLTELVHHGHDGFLWYTTDELRSSTSRLVQDDDLRSQMAQAAIVNSRRFDTAAFQDRLENTLAPLMSR